MASGIAAQWLIVAQDQKPENNQRCSGMYSRKSWGGAVDPFILVKFLKPKEDGPSSDPVVSLVIFEWEDKNLIGKPTDTQDPDEVWTPCRYTKATANPCCRNSTSATVQSTLR